MSVSMCMYVYVCIYVCMYYVRIHVCVCVCVCLCMYVCDVLFYFDFNGLLSIPSLVS